MSSSPSASVATIGFARRERLERGQRRAFPERRKHAEIERAQHGGDIARESDEHEPIAKAELPGLRFERLAQRPLAHEEELRVRLAIEHEPRGIDEIRIALRLVQPRHGADGEIVRRRCRARAARPRSRRPSARRLNSSCGAPR